MSSPDPYFGSTIPLGLQGGGEDEWRNFLRRRAELIEQGMRRLGMAQEISQSVGLPARTAYEAASYADAETQAAQQMQAPVIDEPRWRRLIGAAQFYGIENPEQYEPQLLEQVVEAARGDLNQTNLAQDMTASEKLRLKIINGLSSVSLFGNPEFAAGVLSSLRDVPFAGDWLARKTWYNEANRQAGLISEAVYSNGFIDPPLPPRGLVNFAGESALGAVVGAYTGGTGWLGGISNPIIRGGAIGAVTGLATETGGEESNQQKAIKVAEFAIGGAVLDLGISVLASRLARSFPGARGPIDPDWQQTGWRPSDVPEAEWSVVRGQLGRGPEPMGMGVTEPMPMAPSPTRPSITAYLPEQTQSLPMFEAPPGVHQVRQIPSGNFLLRGEPERIVVRALGPGEAAVDAAALTKQATVLESPLAADLAHMPRIDEAEVALAAMARAPGQISVIRDVGDTGKVVRKFLQEYMPNGVGPQDFRVVQRQITGVRSVEALPEDPNVPFSVMRTEEAGYLRTLRMQIRQQGIQQPLDIISEGGQERIWDGLHRLAVAQDLGVEEVPVRFVTREGKPVTVSDILVSDGSPISQKIVKQYESFGMFSGQQATTTQGLQVTLVEPGAEVSKVRMLGGEESLVPTRELFPQRSSFVSDVAPEAYQRMKAYVLGRMSDETLRAGLIGPELAPARFTTAKGSVYEVRGQSTVRDKAPRAEHPGSLGPQPRSQTTVYVNKTALDKLAEFQTEGQGKRLRIEGGYAGVEYTDGPDAGKIEQRTVVQVSTSPEVGLHPVEVWNGGKEVHFGNEITEIAPAVRSSHVVTDWFSEELASQLPRYVEEFLDAAGIEGPATRGAYKALFTELRVREFKTLAPEEFAQAEALVAEVNARQLPAAMETPVYLEEVAETKGMRWIEEGMLHPAAGTDYIYPAAVVSQNTQAGMVGPSGEVEGPWRLTYFDEDMKPVGHRSFGSSAEAYGYAKGEGWTTSGGRLQDVNSGEVIPFTDRDAALQFLQNLDRELPDYSPESMVPAELVSYAHGASPGVSQGPVHTMDEGRIVADAMRDMDRIEQIAAGGGEPPDPPSTSLVGTAPEPPEPSMPEETLGGQFAAMRGTAPTPASAYNEVMSRFDNMVLNLAEPMRNSALHIERVLTEAGISKGTYWEAYSAIANGRAVAHNEATPMHREVNHWLNQIRRRFVRDGTVTLIGEVPEAQAIAMMQNAGYNQREMNAQLALRPMLERWRQEYEIAKIMDYMPHLRAREARGEDWGHELEAMVGGPGRFFAEMVREGSLDVREMNASVLLHRWARAATFHRHVAPHVEAMRAEWVNDPRVPDRFREDTADWLSLVVHGHTMGQQVLLPGVRHALNSVGIPVTNAEVIRAVQWVFTTMYRGALGGRPDVLMRDMIGPLFGGTKIGFTPVVKSYTQFLKGGQGRDEMWNLALEGGWVEREMVPMGASEMFSTEMGVVPGTAFPEQPFSGWQNTLREGVARTGDVIRDAMPTPLRSGITGTWADPIYAYSKLGQFNRLISGHAGYTQMRDAITAFDTGRAQLTAELKPLVAQLLRDSGAASYHHVIQRKIAELVTARQYEEAARLFANEVANSQFRYGSIEGPRSIRRLGVVGKVGSTFGTFTNQYVAQMRDGFLNTGLAPDFGGTSTDRVTSATKFAARQALVGGALAAATAYTGWNFAKWYWHGSLGWSGGPMLLAFVIKTQEYSGRFQQARGEYVSPIQEAAIRQSEYGVNPWTNLNPLGGTIRTIEGLGTAISAADPFETTAQFLVTGRLQDASMVRILDDPQSLRWLPGVTPQPAPYQALPAPLFPSGGGTAQ